MHCVVCGCGCCCDFSWTVHAFMRVWRQKQFVDFYWNFIFSVGEYLGDLTDELNGSHVPEEAKVHITEFTCAGPKSYAYKTSDNVVVVKAKGIKKTLKNVKSVNLRSMLKCIDHRDMHRRASNLVFQLDRVGRVRSHHTEKIFRCVFDKRYIGRDYRSYPWGYRESS